MPNTDDNGKTIENSVFVSGDKCKKCGSKNTEMRNYSMIWHEGDIYCADCGAYIRMFDAG